MFSKELTHGSCVCKVSIKNDMVYSCSIDNKVMAWSIQNKQKKYEIMHGSRVYDFVIGFEETPLASRLVSISLDKTCRISNIETGTKVKEISFDSCCRSIAVDKAQTLIAVGTDQNVTFIETTNFTKVKEIPLEYVYSLAFNSRNDSTLAITANGEVHSFKF